MIPRLRWMALLSGLLILCTAGPAAAQLEDALSGIIGENAEGYLKPLPSALSSTMNSAIFKTGTLPAFGLDLAISVKAMAVEFDDADRFYEPVDPPGFQRAPGEVAEVPTVIGDEQSVPIEGVANTVWYFPGGFDLQYFGIAMPQFEIGTIMGTRAVFRWIPEIDLGDSDLGTVELLGFGAQHSISQHLPMLPVGVAVGFFYQDFKVGNILQTKSLHLNVTGSKKWAIFEPYIGLGQDSFEMDAEYTLEIGDEEETVEVKFDKETNFHFTAGLNITLPLIAVHGEYNAAAETGFALGVTFGI